MGCEEETKDSLKALYIGFGLLDHPCLRAKKANGSSKTVGKSPGRSWYAAHPDQLPEDIAYCKAVWESLSGKEVGLDGLEVYVMMSRSVSWPLNSEYGLGLQ